MKALRFVAQAGLLALCLIPVGRQLAQDGASITALAAGLHLLPVAGAVVLQVLAAFGLPVALAAYGRGQLRSQGPGSRRISYRDSAVAYFASQPLKYLPGGFWVLPGRVVLLQRMGHDPALSSGGLLFEMIAQALAGALVAVGLLPFLGAAAGNLSAALQTGLWAVLAVAAALCGLLLAAPTWFKRLRRGPTALRGAAERLATIPWRWRLASLGITLLACAWMWLLTGASFYLLLVADAPRLDPQLLLTALGVSTLSSLAGFLTPISPGGIGVREAAVSLLLTGVTTGPQATLVAVLSRGLALAVEIGLAAGAGLVIKTRDLTGLPRPVRSASEKPVWSVRRALRLSGFSVASYRPLNRPLYPESRKRQELHATAVGQSVITAALMRSIQGVFRTWHLFARQLLVRS